MTDFKNKREEVLLTANQIVNGDRNVSYGDPNADFKRTATMWNMLINERRLQGKEISASDVGIMMVMLKCSRHMHSPKLDNNIDIAGYAACAADAESAKPLGINDVNKITEKIYATAHQHAWNEYDHGEGKFKHCAICGETTMIR